MLRLGIQGSVAMHKVEHEVVARSVVVGDGLQPSRLDSCIVGEGRAALGYFKSSSDCLKPMTCVAGVLELLRGIHTSFWTITVLQHTKTNADLCSKSQHFGGSNSARKVSLILSQWQMPKKEGANFSGRELPYASCHSHPTPLSATQTAGIITLRGGTLCGH